MLKETLAKRKNKHRSSGTPEGLVKDDIKYFLDAIEAHYFMPVQKGYGDRAVDFLVCWRGLYIAIEAKAFGEKPTAKQIDYMKRVEDAGGVGMAIDDLEQLPSIWTLLCRSKLITPPDICFMRGEPLRKAIGAPVRRTSKADTSNYPRMQLSRSDSPISSGSMPPGSTSPRRSKSSDTTGRAGSSRTPRKS